MKPAEFLQQHSNEIVLYERMTAAIAKCVSIDEVKSIRHKAHAIQVYAAQAQNFEAESQAIKIRLRAERRCGQLLKESKASGTRQGQGGNKSKITSSDFAPPTLKDLGISPQQSSDWQKMADVPEDKFEAKLNDSTVKPSTSELIDKKPPPGKIVTADVLFVWGQICEFYKGGYLKRDPAEMFSGMTDTMQDDLEFVLPQLIPWLTGLSRRSSDERTERPREFVLTQPVA